MNIHIKQTTALHEQGGRFKNEDFVYPVLDGSDIDNTVSEAIPNVTGLYMVCDGIGGENKGEVASQLAVAQFARYFDTFPPSSQVTYGYLSAALLRVEEAFSNYTKTHPESRGMGTTMALLYLDEYGATAGWIGNSRAYHFRGGELLFKSRDHTVVNDLIEQGKITQDEAEDHPQRNVILRSIKGTEEPTDLDVHFIALDTIEDGDYLFICTDGVFEEVHDKELARIFANKPDIESVRQEIFSLCKGSSGDNFSCYLIEAGIEEKAGIAAGLGAGIATGFDDPLVIEPDSARDEEEFPIEEAFALDSPETVISQANNNNNGNTVLDQIEEEEKPAAAEVISGKSLYDKLKADQQAHGEEKTDEPVKEKVADKRPKTTSAPPPQADAVQAESTGNFLIPVALITIATVFILAAIWILNFRQADPYTDYTSRATEWLEKGEFDRAISLADSAFYATEDVSLRREANQIREDALNRKQEALQTLLDKAGYYKEEGGYPGYWMAREHYQEAVNDYSDVADVMSIAPLIEECTAALNKIDKKLALSQLLSSASLLCSKGQGSEASAYFSEANVLAENQDLMREVEKARRDCQSQIEMIAENTPQDKGSLSRELASPENPGAGKASSGSDDGMGDLSSLGPPKTKSVPPSNQETARELPKTTVPTSKPNNSLGKTRGGGDGDGGSTNTGPLGGFMATRDGSPPPTEAQMASMLKGKALYNQSRNNGSRYQEQKAVEYFEKSGSAMDGEAFYMMANLYNNGHGLEKDDDKVLAYAQKASSLGNPDGAYLFASILLATNNAIDAANAKEALNMAASKGHQPSIDKLGEIQADLAARATQ